MPSHRCTVSFTDSTGITHAVEVSAASLFEAAALAVAEFRRCGFADAEVGTATSLAVTVPAAGHEPQASGVGAGGVGERGRREERRAGAEDDGSGRVGWETSLGHFSPGGPPKVPQLQGATENGIQRRGLGTGRIGNRYLGQAMAAFRLCGDQRPARRVDGTLRIGAGA